MFRTMMMFTSATAFALPMALSQPATARPLATPVDPVGWCWGDCESDKDDDNDNDKDIDIDIDIKVCFKAEFGEDRDVDSCEIVTGRECLARCTPEAVAASCELSLADGVSPRSLASCEDERMDACREQCYSGGAGFCELRGGGGWKPGAQPKPPGHCKDDHHAHQGVGGWGHKWFDKKCRPMKNRPKPMKPGHHKDDHKDDDHHGDNDNDGFVFVDVEACFDLSIDIESKDDDR